MKVSAITPHSVRYNAVPSLKIQEIPTESAKPAIPIMRISFKGNPDKNPGQIAAYATENNFLGGIYKAGGLGDVAEALPEAIAEHGKTVTNKDIDIRTFLPYHSFDNNEGKIYVLKAESAENIKNNPNYKPTRGNDFFLVDSDYKLKNGESFALITEARDGNKVDRYFLLKDANLKGSVERVAMDSFAMENIPYRVFEVDTNGARKDKMYVIHTPEVASGKSSYGIYQKYRTQLNNGSSAYGGSTAYGGRVGIEKKNNIFYSGRVAGDMFYTEQVRAMEEALEKMSSNPGGKFNPQNIILNDRFGYEMLSDAIQKQKSGNKYYEGMRYVPIFHNIGRSYQGCYMNPIDFFKVVATRKDLENLKASPHFSQIESLSKKIAEGKATGEECLKVYNFFKSYFPKYLDSEGLFNMTMIAIDMAEENPGNCVPGNVSKYFGKETRDMATEDIAKGLTQQLKGIENKTVDVVNGAKPANMATGKQDGFFGTGTLNEIFKDTNDPRKYTPYLSSDSPEVIYEAKASNKKNLINIIADAASNLDNDNDAVAKVFFNDTKISAIRGADKDLALTLGGFSKFKEGDILFTTWGRPDPQKGLPITLEAFEALLKDESVPLEIRKHCKLLLGAGGGNDAFREGHSEWTAIKEAVQRIEGIESGGQKGIFKGNVCYVNGLFPNRIANCADLAIFTSRYEPCGITPFESYAAGTPVLSIKTGGAPDFIKPGKTGMLTDEPFMLSAEKLGLAADTPYEDLDKARKNHSSKQIAQKLKEYLKSLDDNTFADKQKTYIENCLQEKVEWHNNNSYNEGKSALDLYLNSKLHTKDNNIPIEIKSDARGTFDETVFRGGKPGNEGGKWFARNKKLAIGAVCILALAGLGYKLVGKSSKTEKKDKEEKHLSAIG